MDIFDNNKKYITRVFDLNIDDISKINHQLMKDIIFVDSKNYKYHPSFFRIYFISPDYTQAYIISIFDELEKEKQNLDNPIFLDGFFTYLINEYKIQKEAIEDAIQIIKDTPKKAEIIDRIMSTYTDYKKNIDGYFNYLPPVDMESSPQKSPDNWSSYTSPTSYSQPSSSPTSSSPTSIGDIFETLNREITVKEKILDTDFDIYLRYLYVVLSKKNLLREVKYEELFRDFVLDNNFLAVGLNIGGESKFRIVKTSDKPKTKNLKIFTHSEHKVTETKFLLPNVFYFLYHVSKDIYITGEVRNDLVIVLRIVFSEKFILKDIEQLEQDMNVHTYKIFEKFKQKIPNLIENPDKNFVKISIKMVHKTGKIDKEIIKNTFITNLKETHKGTILNFDLQVDDFTIKNIIYSEKINLSNFSIKGIPNKLYIPSVINKLSYPFKTGSKVKESIKPKIKKQDIKDLSSLNIPYDSRKCQKDRRIDILKSEEVFNQNRLLNYKGNILVCRNNDYPYPGETKTGIPCCFKKIQRIKEINMLEPINIVKTINIRPIMKEKEELVQFRREGIYSRLLEDVFPVSEGFYALTLANEKIGIPDVLSIIYGNDIINEAFVSLSKEDREYFSISEDREIKDIIKAVTLFKKTNLMVISYTGVDFSFVCSMSETLVFDQFIILLMHNNNYKILVKSIDEVKQIGWVFGKSNKNLQRLIRAYNSSCLGTKDCGYNIPDLKKILNDNILTVKAGVIDPITNKIIYLETDVGIIPIKPSNISYNITSKTLNNMDKLSYNEQKNKLKDIEGKYEYLTTTGDVFDESKSNITGLRTICNFIVPTLQEVAQNIAEDGEVFDINIYEKLKQTIMSGEELDMYKEDFLNNYKETAANTIKKYYIENQDQKVIIINLIEDGNFEELLKVLNKLFLIQQKVEIPIDNSTTVPIPIEEDQLLDVLSYITWLLMNNSEEFFTDSMVKDRTNIDVSLIPNLEEVELDESAIGL